MKLWTVAMLLVLVLTACSSSKSGSGPKELSYRDVITALQTAGLQASAVDASGAYDTLFMTTKHELKVDGITLHVLAYPPGMSAVTTDGGHSFGIMRDGKVIGGAEIDWAAKPHVVMNGNLLVVYATDDVAASDRIGKVLENIGK